MYYVCVGVCVHKVYPVSGASNTQNILDKGQTDRQTDSITYNTNKPRYINIVSLCPITAELSTLLLSWLPLMFSVDKSCR